MQKEEFPQVLPPKYYHTYFGLLIEFIQKRYIPILEKNEIDFLMQYQNLSENAQCLFIRFSNRSKLFFRISKLSYEEIVDIPASLEELLNAGFISFIDEDHAHFIEEIVQLFTKEELLVVTKKFQPEIMPAKSIKKIDLIRWLVYEYEIKELAHVLNREDEIIKVNFENEFALMKFLFFGNRHTDMTEFVMRDLGHVHFQPFQEDQLSIRFETRKDVNDMLMVSLTKEIFYHNEGKLPPEEIYDWFMNWQTGVSKNLSKIALPSYHRFVLKIASWLERKKMLSQALAVYQLSDQVPSRERRVRILSKLGDTEEAIALCEEILINPQNADERFFSMDYSEKIINKKKRATKKTTQALKAAEFIEIPIENRFQVESGAIKYYLDQGYYAFFSENEPWRNIFGLLFWDIIYDTNVQAIHNPLQRVPSDFFLPDFYYKREKLLKEKVAQWHSKEIIASELETIYHKMNGIANVLVSWYEGSLKRALLIINFLEIEQIKLVLMEMANNLRENTRGFPDLFVWNENEYHFYEIKSPTDHLSAQQLHWLHFFNQVGINSKVIRVKWLTTEI